MMIDTPLKFEVRLAQTGQDMHAVQRLRYDVFVNELGGDGAEVDHEARLERDALDAYCDHLMLIDQSRDMVAGVYRLLPPEKAVDAGRYYSDAEYDLSVLRNSGKRLLELGRSCLHADYRGGTAMHHLWSGLAQYVADRDVDILFGVASFHGTDIPKIAGALSLLHQRHLAPTDLRVKALPEAFQSMDLVPEADLDRTAAMRSIPSLMKAYLRLGGFVGEGAFVDHAFNTTDVCLIMDTARLSKRQARIYGGRTS
ncbi:Ornithine-acyl(Acyl carrier protein) N-acyltransferase [Sulfitobacter noctilucicola]|uniref:L-ornithine N(alpha)-acyltransferase n=1 Tax=Sulfitobacter noctilucicola TaxID=1342301 RepID=A0A7W6Q360_9RHOB|nr:GNAT family N-acyltransferase [Sulfitobacter noctilucicola]KIN65051.1 Ornithine-acyl(Acyl carrier protein) N-acyltransferase [Sulfitobacter noctilucicola]MBB4173810.1 putative hemolysin [Sulfitobacter noctilucicola]